MDESDEMEVCARLLRTPSNRGSLFSSQGFSTPTWPHAKDSYFFGMGPQIYEDDDDNGVRSDAQMGDDDGAGDEEQDIDPADPAQPRRIPLGRRTTEWPSPPLQPAEQTEQQPIADTPAGETDQPGGGGVQDPGSLPHGGVDPLTMDGGAPSKYELRPDGSFFVNGAQSDLGRTLRNRENTVDKFVEQFVKDFAPLVDTECVLISLRRKNPYTTAFTTRIEWFNEELARDADCKHAAEAFMTTLVGRKNTLDALRTLDRVRTQRLVHA